VMESTSRVWPGREDYHGGAWPGPSPDLNSLAGAATLGQGPDRVVPNMGIASAQLEAHTGLT
jgi:hypothetical protein